MSAAGEAVAASRRAEGRADAGFVVLMALMSSVLALSTDAMIPALGRIAADLAVPDPNDRQLVILTLFVGVAISQFVFGPVSDAIGRKPAALIGFAVFLAGSALSMLARDFETMLAGRLLQGLGAGGPRIISLAIIRDLYEGRAMARVVSLMSSIFILVPMLAPAMGQAVYALMGWRAIFAVFIAIAAGTAIWLAVGCPESLPRARRAPFSARVLVAAVVETLSHPVSLGYSVLTGVVFGAFLAYIAGAQQIYQEIYDLGPWFPLAFASLAGAFGVATLVNARLVMRIGMRPMTRIALMAMTGGALLGLAVSVAVFGGRPPLAVFLLGLAPVFFSVGLMFGNFNALALEPLGHIAGAASSVVTSLSTFIAMGLALATAAAFDGTVTPLFGAFSLFGLGAIAIFHLTERARARREARAG